ncbi:hypothetical protein [Thorsellia anophelis]|uniref:Uncharacterized protein n=1 Tax=Thorsellia anophelis DSM 18579 TaxID=1123402 RepID=A0A1I0F5L1_9GAMM|nr:hypothetical protein [Thorsellia anophelis]SET52709.1 hypothetical protein SAMN02583745_02636 [Thorsellia anophelis DSM 18579]
MNNNDVWIPFRYWHVFIFFIGLSIFNFLALYAVDVFPLSYRMIFFLANSIGGTLMLSLLILVWTDMAKSVKQKLAAFFWITTLSTICSYIVVFHAMA